MRGWQRIVEGVLCAGTCPQDHSTIELWRGLVLWRGSTVGRSSSGKGVDSGGRLGRGENLPTELWPPWRHGSNTHKALGAGNSQKEIERSSSRYLTTGS